MNELTAEQLDDVVAECVVNHPERGERMIHATLEARSTYVSRSSLRASIHRVDPEGVEERKSKPIKRRVYSVEGPHHLWHLDGNHKLIKYHIVIRGAIDGFSRAAMFLGASDNNRSETVFHLFLEATKKYGGLPSRIRTDRGGENIKVAEYMLRHCGLGRNSVLTGRSVHNQRIERFWRDFRKDVIEFYKSLFETMETDYHIDFDDQVSIFCLHYLFLPRLNEDLKQYIEIWNSHKIRTENNHTPYQLLLLHREKSAAVEVPEDYGIEEDDEDVDAQEEDYEQVVLPPIHSPLDTEFYGAFCYYFQPLNLTVVDTNEMITYFLDASTYCKQLYLLQQQQQQQQLQD